MTGFSLQEEVRIFVQKNKILKMDFAKLIGITPVKLSHWLGGHTSLDMKTLERVMAILDGDKSID